MTDVIAAVGGAFCLFPGVLSAWLAVRSLRTGGLVFFPQPLVAPGGIVRFLAGLTLALGALWNSPALVAFAVAAAVTLDLQHRLPKRWDQGLVHGLWFTPLAVRALEREGLTLVLVLERGYRLAVPATEANRPFLERITPQEDHP